MSHCARKRPAPTSALLIDALTAEPLAAYIAAHGIADRMRSCGPGSVVTLSMIGQEPDCTPMPTPETDALSSRIRIYIQGAYPGEQIDEERHARTGNYVFRVGPRRVEVTETLLDADDGLAATIHRLDNWNLSRRLTALKPDEVLMIERDGPRTAKSI